MSWVKRYYSEYLENLELLRSSDSLMIFTDYEIEYLREYVWSYEFYSQIDEDFTLIKEESGSELICGCEECEKFGKDLFEYHSIFMALKTVIEDEFPRFHYCLYGASEKFWIDANENVFARYNEIYQCDFLKKLGKDLVSLLSSVSVNYRNSGTEEGVPF